MQLNNYHVVVTGGTRGIGLAISLEFLKEGAKVVAIYHSNDAKAQAMLSELAPEWRERMEIYKLDVSKYDDVAKFYEWYGNKYPSLEVLVNNSGIRKDAITPLMDQESWKNVLDTNLDGTFYMSKMAAVKMMENKFGRIINMSSVGGMLGLPGQANYAASKAGQVALSKVMAKEFGKKGVTVNCVSPGFVQTEMLEGMSADQLKAYYQQIPLKRAAKVDEVAWAVLSLAHPRASYINGANLVVDGGM